MRTAAAACVGSAREHAPARQQLTARSAAQARVERELQTRDPHQRIGGDPLAFERLARAGGNRARAAHHRARLGSERGIALTIHRRAAGECGAIAGQQRRARRHRRVARELLPRAQSGEQERARPHDARAPPIAANGQFKRVARVPNSSVCTRTGTATSFTPGRRGALIAIAGPARDLQLRGRCSHRRVHIGRGEVAHRQLAPRGEVDLRVHRRVIPTRPRGGEARREIVRGGRGGGVGRAHDGTCQERDRREARKRSHAPRAQPVRFALRMAAHVLHLNGTVEHGR